MRWAPTANIRGFPIWNWDALKQDQYRFWKQRLRVASPATTSIGLDHVVGFFRIWCNSRGPSQQEGKFVPEDEKLWIPAGTEHLKMLISASSMLPIAEDLGTVPATVRSTLNQLGVCGTKVIRWERLWNENGVFIPFKFYPPVSMTCVSTHDSPTLALWWRDYPQEAKAFAAFKIGPMPPSSRSPSAKNCSPTPITPRAFSTSTSSKNIWPSIRTLSTPLSKRRGSTRPVNPPHQLDLPIPPRPRRDPRPPRVCSKR